MLYAFVRDATDLLNKGPPVCGEVPIRDFWCLRVDLISEVVRTPLPCFWEGLESTSPGLPHGLKGSFGFQP